MALWEVDDIQSGGELPHAQLLVHWAAWEANGRAPIQPRSWLEIPDVRVSYPPDGRAGCYRNFPELDSR